MRLIACTNRPTRIAAELALQKQLATASSAIGQVICWDRGRPARNEREARKRIKTQQPQNLRTFGALRAGRPRSQHFA